MAAKNGPEACSCLHHVSNCFHAFEPRHRRAPGPEAVFSAMARVFPGSCSGICRCPATGRPSRADVPGGRAVCGRPSFASVCHCGRPAAQHDGGLDEHRLGLGRFDAGSCTVEHPPQPLARICCIRAGPRAVVGWFPGRGLPKLVRPSGCRATQGGAVRTCRCLGVCTPSAVALSTGFRIYMLRHWR